MSLTKAKPYAKALVDLATENKSANDIRKELEGFGALLKKSRDFNVLLTSKVFNRTERVAALLEVLNKSKPSVLLKNFLQLLAENDRFSLFNDIVIAYEKILDEMENIDSANVVSAVTLSAGMKEKLKLKLENTAGKRLNINYEIDKALLGGIVTRIGNQVFDGSVKTQLQSLKIQLTGGHPSA